MLLYFLQDLCSIEALDPEIQVTHEEYMLMINNGHLPLAKILFKRTVENLHQLLGSLIVFAAAGCEVAINYHKSLTFDFKTDAYCAFVASDSCSACFDSARLKRLRRNPRRQLPLKKNGKVASNHLLICVDQLLVVEFFFLV